MPVPIQKSPKAIRIDGIICCFECSRNLAASPRSCSSEYHAERHKKALFYTTRWHKEHPESHLRASTKYRNKAIEHYGAKCSCCGFSDINKIIHGRRFLQIDHVNGGGGKHIRELSLRGTSLYAWLTKNNYPSGFRVLCAACNVAMIPGRNICEIHKPKIPERTSISWREVFRFQ